MSTKIFTGKDFYKAIEHGLHAIETYRGIGIIKMELGQYQEAIEDFRTVVRAEELKSVNQKNIIDEVLKNA